MRFLMLALTLTLLSGCITKINRIEPCGADDYIQLEKDSEIQKVKLKFLNPEQDYTIKTQKPGVWVSLDCWNRLEKGTK